jgi:mono/diheme cytochrome c family protein
MVLRDRAGQIRAALDAAGLSLFDAQGKPRGTFEVRPDGSVRLVILDAEGNNQAVLLFDKDGRLESFDKQKAVQKSSSVQKSPPPKSVPERSNDAKMEPKAKPRSPADEQRYQAAGLLYRKLCQSCHAANGKGKPSRGIPDFTDHGWQESRSDAQLLTSIMKGRGDEMPPFDDRLKQGEAVDLVAFVRALAPKQASNPAPEPPPDATDFDSRLRHLQERWEALERQLRQLKNGRPKG